MVVPTLQTLRLPSLPYPVLAKGGVIQRCFNAVLANFFPKLRNNCQAVLAILLMAGQFNTDVLAESSSEAALKTAFLYNFFKFIQWPDGAIQDSYRLCTAGNDLLGDSLSVLESKKINDKPMLIYRDISIKDISQCHMLFISKSKNSQVMLNSASGMSVVTVSDQPDFAVNGGMIGLVEEDRHLRFEINLTKANAENIHINASLLKLAKSVSLVK